MADISNLEQRINIFLSTIFRHNDPSKVDIPSSGNLITIDRRNSHHTISSNFDAFSLENLLFDL